MAQQKKNFAIEVQKVQEWQRKRNEFELPLQTSEIVEKKNQQLQTARNTAFSSSDIIKDNRNNNSKNWYKTITSLNSAPIFSERENETKKELFSNKGAVKSRQNRFLMLTFVNILLLVSREKKLIVNTILLVNFDIFTQMWVFALLNWRDVIARIPTANENYIEKKLNNGFISFSGFQIEKLRESWCLPNSLDAWMWQYDGKMSGQIEWANIIMEIMTWNGKNTV